MDSHQQSRPSVNRARELQSNVRHITKLAMSWFAFLVTMNYLTMGWFATGSGKNVLTVALVFLLQDFLGIVGLTCVLISATNMKRAISSLQNDADEAQYTIPNRLYNIIGSCLILVLASLILAWIKIGNLFDWFGNNKQLAMTMLLIIVAVGVLVLFVIGFAMTWKRLTALGKTVAHLEQIHGPVEGEVVSGPAPSVLSNAAAAGGIMSNEDQLLDLRKKALDTAIAWSKQVTTLATGTLVLSGTFIKDLFTGHVEWPIVILLSWVAMALSALLGILYVGALVAMVATAKGAEDLDIYSVKNGRPVALIHILAFMAGLVCFMIFVAKNML